MMWAEIERRTPTGTTVAHAIDRYLVEAVHARALTTQSEYRRTSRRLHSPFGHMRLRSVEPFHVEQYLDRHPRKAAANKEVGTVSSVFTKAIRCGWCSENPCRKVEENPETKRDRHIEDEEFVAVRTMCWNYVNENGARCRRPLAVAMEISYLTSFRLSDVIGINLTDIEGDALLTREGNTGWKARAEVTNPLRVVIERAKSLRRRVTSFFLLTQRNAIHAHRVQVGVAMLDAPRHRAGDDQGALLVS